MRFNSRFLRARGRRQRFAGSSVRMTPLAVCAVLAYLFFGVVLLARATNHWQTNLPEQVYMHLVPRVNQLTHPGM